MPHEAKTLAAARRSFPLSNSVRWWNDWLGC
jgi:hypothetical protein